MIGLGLACCACSGPCAEVAERLRECCVKGPEELRARCEAEAQQLEEDGNSDACEAFDTSELDGCAQ